MEKLKGCPSDTDGDGDCGRALCPHCSDQSERHPPLLTRETLRKAREFASRHEPYTITCHPDGTQEVRRAGEGDSE